MIQKPTCRTLSAKSTLRLALLFIASLPLHGLAQGLLDYESVSVINLIATPERFHGKKVVVSGWLTLEVEDMSLCLTQNVASPKECIWVDIEDERLKSLKKYRNELATVHGTFDKDETGHLGGWSGGIIKIARITPARRLSPRSTQ
jgi:hypothetical protein